MEEKRKKPKVSKQLETNQTKGVLVETAMISLKKIPLYMINWGI